MHLPHDPKGQHWYSEFTAEVKTLSRDREKTQNASQGSRPKPSAAMISVTHLK
jgi:hypothetical protein